MPPRPFADPYYLNSDFGIALYCGDCREILPALSFDAVLTDPPFGIDYDSGYGSDVWGNGAVSGDADTLVRDEALAIIGNVPALVFGSWKQPRPKGTRTLLVWDTLGALGMGDLQIPWKPSHQEIYVLGDRKGFAGRRDSDVISHPPVQSMAKNGRLHQMQKPVKLLEKLLEKLVGETICDPFMGSGSTGLACLNLGRKFIGIEIDPGHCETAKQRIETAIRDRKSQFAWGDA